MDKKRISRKKAQEAEERDDKNNEKADDNLAKAIDIGADGETKKLVEQENKQLKWILIGAGFLLFSFLLVMVIVNESKHFDYLGLTFEKQQMGELQFFYTKLPIKTATGQIVNYNLYLRTDPREIKLPENLFVKFRANGTFITVSPEFDDCNDASLALTSLGSFIGGLGINAKGAVTDKDISNKTALPYVTCENSKNKTVILVRKGEKTELLQDSDCYTISVSNCEIIKGTESFILGVIKSMKQASGN